MPLAKLGLQLAVDPAEVIAIVVAGKGERAGQAIDVYLRDGRKIEGVDVANASTNLIGKFPGFDPSSFARVENVQPSDELSVGAERRPAPGAE